MEIADRYFYLSDFANKDADKLAELCHLFSDDAVIEPYNGKPLKGKAALTSFFTAFFAKNAESKHLWQTTTQPDGTVQVEWGVVVRRKTGAFFALTGRDSLTIANGKITHLIIVGNN